MNLIDVALVIQLFVLINPLSSFPVLISAYKNKMNVRKIAMSAVFIAFIIAIVIALIGPFIFNLFNITIDSFRIAGGVVLLLLGLDTIRSEKEEKDVKKIDSLISIIATPILTGPATISFLIVKTFEVGYFSIISDLVIAFIIVAVVVMIFAFSIGRVNEKVISISSKVFGLFLTAIAIEMIAKGIQGFLAVPK